MKPTNPINATCPDCRTDCGHEELEHCAADGPRPAPASIHALVLDAAIRLASGAELVAMRDAERMLIRHYALRAGLALDAGNDKLEPAKAAYYQSVRVYG